MKILVYGLGIIGASIAAGLKRAGHYVAGRNRTKTSVQYALDHGMIDEEAESYDGAEVVVLALPPRVVLRELAEGRFPEGCVVTDICGVKLPLERAVLAKSRNYKYVGLHPMAGKETVGIASSDPELFRGANLVITRNAGTDGAALKTVRALADDLGFGTIVECSAEEHDRMIALTSQLAHIVSNAYIKTPSACECAGFTGGSFQDMTRIASLDEDVWTELFFLNRENLSREIARLTKELEAYRAALDAGNEDEMRTLLRRGKQFHEEFLKKNRRK